MAYGSRQRKIKLCLSLLFSVTFCLPTSVGPYNHDGLVLPLFSFSPQRKELPLHWRKGSSMNIVPVMD